MCAGPGQGEETVCEGEHRGVLELIRHDRGQKWSSGVTGCIRVLNGLALELTHLKYRFVQMSGFFSTFSFLFFTDLR